MSDRPVILGLVLMALRVVDLHQRGLPLTAHPTGYAAADRTQLRRHSTSQMGDRQALETVTNLPRVARPV